MRLRRFAGLTIALAAAAAAWAQDPTAAGTMPEDYLPGLRPLLESAMRRSPTMINQALTVAQDEAQMLIADSQMLPQISGSANYETSRVQIAEVTTQNGVTSSLSSPPNTGQGLFYGINGSETLFHWGQLFNNRKINKIQLEIAERQYDQAYQDLATQIREAYLGLVLGKMSLRNDRYNQGLAEEQLKIVQDQVKHGDLPPTALGAPQLAVGDAALAADQAQEAYDHGKRALAEMAGVSAIDDGAIPLDLPLPAYSEARSGALLAAFLRDGAKSTFLAEVYQMQIDQARLRYRIAAVNLLPWISAGAGFSLSNQNSFNAASGGEPSSVTQVGVKSENYGVTVNWNIFDGLNTHGQKRTYLAQRRQAEAQLASYLDSTLEDAQDRERQVAFAYRAVELAETRADYSRSAFFNAQQDFARGFVAKSAVEDARAGDYAGEAAAADARRNFLCRWCEYVSAVGADPILNDLPLNHARLPR